MEYGEHIAAVRGDIDGLVAVAGAGPSDAAVPTCPEWTVRDLAVHVGEFCGFWAHVLCEGTGRPKAPYREPPAGDGLAGWLDELGSMLVAELSATPSSSEVWTWHDADHSAGFVARRSAHELAIHRYDAQSARGTCGAIPASLAADGIDEILTVLVDARPRTGRAAGESMHVHASDTGDDWIVRLEPDRIEVGRRAAPADLALEGTASDVELLLYGRPTLGDVNREGDDAVLGAWRREFLF